MKPVNPLIAAAAGVIAALCTPGAYADAQFGPSNPFFAESTLPFHAPPFDRIKDQDYQPAIEAGMAEELAEMRRIADDPRPATFENTFVAMERSGALLDRAEAVFNGVSASNTNPVLQAAKSALAPELAAHDDAIYLDQKLFGRVASVYRGLGSLKLDADAQRLVHVVYDRFVHAGANVPAADMPRLKQLNAEAARLSDEFSVKLREATANGAFVTAQKQALAGLSDAQLSAAADAARQRKLGGYLIALQNTTQQPLLSSLEVPDTRRAIFENSWNRAERGDANDTRAIIVRLASLRAERAKLLGFANHAAWKLEDQMAKTPQAALAFMDALVPVAVRKSASEAAEIRAADGAKDGAVGLEPWDWDYGAEKVRKSRFDLDAGEIKPYFEIGNVLENGVFYAATQLYGITFKERKDIPVYHPDVRVFEVRDADGKPLALFYCDYFKRDNKDGGAWMSNFVHPSKLLHQLPVVFNVANLPKPAPGEPALITFTDVTTMFHEFGHALHGMFADTRFPTLSGTTPARDFVEFPSQFNEHWALYPSVFRHFARHYRTGAPMPDALVEKIKQASNFNQGYSLTETLEAAELDMQWHVVAPGTTVNNADEFERQALEKVHLDIHAVPPRYRSSYFSHIWAGGYSAGYYAYLWTQMLDDDAYQWFDDHGGLTRANGERFRRMVLARGNTVDLGRLYERWRGKPPTVEAMMKYRGLNP